MKKLILIHTVGSVYVSFPRQLQEAANEKIQIESIVDEFFANEANRIGKVTVANKNRFFCLMKAAELADPDIIVVTCSTLSPLIEEIKPYISKKIIAIDDAMCKEAAAKYSNILLVATAESAIEPTKHKIISLKDTAKEIKQDIVLIDKAIACLKSGDPETHDNIVMERMAEYKNSSYDSIVLCQASLAHLEKPIQELLGIPVLSTPQRCINQTISELFTEGR
ncbi:MAG TPA: aspartate/glutamate racemase family protein [Clostridiaceae bacterium]|nr:aspartate/glutamate racemase family protein [Clostridiaceae bacterium]